MVKKDMIDQMHKLFVRKSDVAEEHIPIERRKMYMDPSNVCGVVPKYEHIERLMKEYFDVEETEVPSFLSSYAQNLHDNVGIGKYSKEYMKVVLSIVSKTDGDWISVGAGKEFPLYIECDELIAFIAPRVSND